MDRVAPRAKAASTPHPDQGRDEVLWESRAGRWSEDVRERSYSRCRRRDQSMAGPKGEYLRGVGVAEKECRLVNESTGRDENYNLSLRPFVHVLRRSVKH